MKYLISALTLLTLLLSCGQSNNPGSQISSKEEAEILSTENAQTYLAPNYERIRAEYNKAVPLWDKLKGFSITPIEECKLKIEIKYKGQTVQYEVDVKQLDPENMKVFEDEEFIPGARFFAKEEKNIIQKRSGGNSESVNFLEIQLPTRESVEEFVFAFVNILNYCQEGDLQNEASEQ